MRVTAAHEAEVAAHDRTRDDHARLQGSIGAVVSEWPVQAGAGCRAEARTAPCQARWRGRRGCGGSVGWAVGRAAWPVLRVSPWWLHGAAPQLADHARLQQAVATEQEAHHGSREAAQRQAEALQTVSRPPSLTAARHIHRCIRCQRPRALLSYSYLLSY